MCVCVCVHSRECVFVYMYLFKWLCVSCLSSVHALKWVGIDQRQYANMRKIVRGYICKNIDLTMLGFLLKVFLCPRPW
jgi:hypothetical protein